MKLYAQHGFQEGEKINEGLSLGLLDGVIYSPKDVSLQRLKEKLGNIRKEHAESELFLDPQFYVSLIADTDSRLGNLADDYGYFAQKRRGQLESEKQVSLELDACLGFQKKLNVTSFIAPNILIPRSLNSIEAMIAKNFIKQSYGRYAKLKDKRPLYATLAISREALKDIPELISFLNDITIISEKPIGIYLIISSRSVASRSDIFNADVLLAWLLINYSLTVSGFKVINGYSDLVSPLLGAVGGYAGSTGWFSNQRFFSTERFGPARPGGRLPNQRYLSIKLLNRIAFYELDALRKIEPHIINKLSLDKLYDVTNGSEPQRNQEILQSWEALKYLNQQVDLQNIKKSLNKFKKFVESANSIYDRVEGIFPLDVKSNRDHLMPLSEGIRLFSELAEIPLV